MFRPSLFTLTAGCGALDCDCEGRCLGGVVIRFTAEAVLCAGAATNWLGLLPALLLLPVFLLLLFPLFLGRPWSTTLKGVELRGWMTEGGGDWKAGLAAGCLGPWFLLAPDCCGLRLLCTGLRAACWGCCGRC